MGCMTEFIALHHELWKETQTSKRNKYVISSNNGRIAGKNEQRTGTNSNLRLQKSISPVTTK